MISWRIAVAIIGVAFGVLEVMNMRYMNQAFEFAPQNVMGTNINLPFILSDGASAGAFYLVDPKIASSLLPAQVEPTVVPLLNRAVVALHLAQYNTSLGPCTEATLTMQTRKAHSHLSINLFVANFLAHMYHFKWLWAPCYQSGIDSRNVLEKLILASLR